MNKRDMIINKRDADYETTFGLTGWQTDADGDNSTQLFSGNAYDFLYHARGKNTSGTDFIDILKKIKDDNPFNGTSGFTVDNYLKIYLDSLRITIREGKFQNEFKIAANQTTFNKLNTVESSKSWWVIDNTLKDDELQILHDGKRYGEINLEFEVKIYGVVATDGSNPYKYNVILHSIPYTNLQLLERGEIPLGTTYNTNDSGPQFRCINRNNPNDIRVWGGSDTPNYVRVVCDRLSWALLTDFSNNTSQPFMIIPKEPISNTYSSGYVFVNYGSILTLNTIFNTTITADQLQSITLDHTLNVNGDKSLANTSQKLELIIDIVKELSEICASEIALGDCVAMQYIKTNENINLTSPEYLNRLYMCIKNDGFSPILVTYGIALDEFVGKFDMYIDNNNEKLSVIPETPSDDPYAWKYSDAVDEYGVLEPFGLTVEILPGKCLSFTKIMTTPVQVWNYNALPGSGH